MVMGPPRPEIRSTDVAASLPSPGGNRWDPPVRVWPSGHVAEMIHVLAGGHSGPGAENGRKPGGGNQAQGSQGVNRAQRPGRKSGVWHDSWQGSCQLEKRKSGASIRDFGVGRPNRWRMSEIEQLSY